MAVYTEFQTLPQAILLSVEDISGPEPPAPDQVGVRMELEIDDQDGDNAMVALYLSVEQGRDLAESLARMAEIAEQR